MLRAIKRAHPDSEVWWIASHITAMADALRIHTEHLVAHVETDLQLKEAPHRTVPRLLKLPRFDMVFDARTRVLDVLVAKMALRPREFYACLPGFFLSTRRPTGVFKRPRGVGERAMSMAIAAFGAAADGSGSLPSSNAAQEAAERDLPAGPIYVGLAPGSREAKKNWPLQRFIEVAKALAASGYVPVFMIGPFEQAWLPEIQAGVPQALFPESAPVDRALAVMSRLTAMLANDSGLGHLTAAAGVPLVSLFGPTDAERWRPFGSDVQVIRAQEFGGESMEAIPVEPVLAALRERLATTPATVEAPSPFEPMVDELAKDKTHP